MGSGEVVGGEAGRWGVRRRRGVLEAGYGRGSDFPQLAALHLDSGYFRLTYGREGGWGTSVVLLPSCWIGGVYHQGAPVAATWEADGAALRLTVAGQVAGLDVRGDVRLAPPGPEGVQADVRVRVGDRGGGRGVPALDHRPGEAFKPVLLSSMRVAPDRWDACAALVDGREVPIPAGGATLPPRTGGTRIGLRGGTSRWKRNAPTVEVTLDGAWEVGGWVTPSGDPNDDNVALWAAAPAVRPEWRYRLTARP